MGICSWRTVTFHALEQPLVLCQQQGCCQPRTPMYFESSVFPGCKVTAKF